MKLLVCGGAGFIGSNFARQRIVEHGDAVTVLDKLTYAGREENLADVRDSPGFAFVHAGIEDADAVREAMEGRDAVVNNAAETHVDRSIAEQRLAGVRHAAAAGHCSWHEFAAAIFAATGAAVELSRGRTADLGRPAPRPAYSVLRSERPDTPVLPPWRDGLRAYLELGVIA